MTKWTDRKYGEMFAIGLITSFVALLGIELPAYWAIFIAFILGCYAYWRVVVLIRRRNKQFHTRVIHNTLFKVWQGQRLPQKLVFNDFKTDEDLLMAAFDAYADEYLEKYKRIQDMSKKVKESGILVEPLPDISEDFNAQNVGVINYPKKDRTDGCGNN